MHRVLPAQNCGLDLIAFLNTNNKASNKEQALAILSAMLDAGFLQPIVPDSEDSEFDENLHYKFVELPRQIFSFKGLTEERLDDSIQSPKSLAPQPPKSIDSTQFSFHSSPDDEVENAMRSTTTTSKLLESYCEHEEQMLAQQLRSDHLDLRWSKVLIPLCSRAANHFKSEYCTNELMDIRNYVNFKKIPGGKRLDCAIVNGVVFSKNVAHKDMAMRVESPRILLLQCPIVYERVEGKFISISTVMLQEKEYLTNVCSRIMSFKPNVVLVHKNVAGIAQDILRAHNITLVLDVKMSVMERLSRTLQCDIVTSIDSNISKPKLGICDAFYIRNFSDGNGSSKTLMYCEKFNSPRGFTCLLRGGNSKELSKIKRIASFLVYARYNWRLEMSFLLDEFALPLSPKPPIFESKETSPASENASNEDEEADIQLRSKPRRILIERKSEDKISVATENVHDFSDPLRSTNPSSDKNPLENSTMELSVETRYDNRFRNALSSTILSISPFLSFPLPYLETELGRKCVLRSLFPSELYFSKQWSNDRSSSIHNNNLEKPDTVTETSPNNCALIEASKLRPAHPFLQLKITAPIDNKDIQTLLAEFRAFGGRYPKQKKFMFKLLKKRQNSQQQQVQKLGEEQIYKDALDLYNHQRLPVLFCSFYANPKVDSSFCTAPTLLDMKFYGQYDIMLGQFLQRYCCHLSTICPLCNLPMVGHSRRFVHSMGAVQVDLSADISKVDPNRMFFTSWCSICNEVTPSVPLSDTSKCLSFAKYLEMRFHGHAYKKRNIEGISSASTAALETVSSQCQHSLHRDYIHYFTYKGVGAKFHYMPIEIWEIGLPSLILTLQPPKPFDRFQVMEEMKTFSTKGHEVYTGIHERIADLAAEDENSPLVTTLKTALSKDHFIFKQHVEIVQTLLTETKANSFDVNDAMLMSKRVLAESIDLWGPRLHQIAAAQKQAAKQLHDTQSVDAGTICTEDLHSEMVHNSAMTQSGESLSTTSGEVNSNTQHDDEEAPPLERKLTGMAAIISEKKYIKKMLTQLLPSTGQASMLQSPFSSTEHYSLPLGAFPILVQDHDLSSIIAYCLTSTDYQRLVTALGNNSNTSNNTEASSKTETNAANTQPSPNLKRKASENSHQEHEDQSKDNNNKPPNAPETSSTTNNNHNEEERFKTKSCNSHLEITLQNNSTQLTCKIYFAQEFDIMRAKSLKPPKMDKSLYKELEISKKREEIKVSQSRSGPEIELVRKPSDVGSNSTRSETNTLKEETNELQKEIENCRQYLARSLCSSVEWEARGGKSGSRFCKTSDDRFVLKEMSKNDIHIFENFAPNYFEYIAKCQQQNQPTLLAKIFGVFKVTIKKKDSFIEKSLLVMENLFYECEIENKFDLKGSERNRLVDPTNQNGEIVLLDENLMQMSWSKPLYILSHSKAVLRDAINRDSSFLAKNHVMDYSLLVGLDNKTGVLVLGIIDYIRTYTFDKMVESFVKQTRFLGGGMGKLPTVIPPERYKQRFTDAMDRYFNTAPDRWEGFSKI